MDVQPGRRAKPTSLAAWLVARDACDLEDNVFQVREAVRRALAVSNSVGALIVSAATENPALFVVGLDTRYAFQGRWVKLTRNPLASLIPRADPSIGRAAEKHDLLGTYNSNGYPRHKVCLVHTRSPCSPRARNLTRSCVRAGAYRLGKSPGRAQHSRGSTRVIASWLSPASLCTGAYSLTRRVGG